MIDILDNRSEGEIGANIGLTDSAGEMKSSKFGQNTSTKNRYAKDDRPFGQTIDYEGGLTSHSKTKSGMRTSQDDLNPIYDSKEDPIPRAKKQGGAKNNMLMSGESFGNPLNRSSGNN